MEGDSLFREREGERERKKKGVREKETKGGRREACARFLISLKWNRMWNRFARKRTVQSSAESCIRGDEWKGGTLSFAPSVQLILAVSSWTKEEDRGERPWLALCMEPATALLYSHLRWEWLQYMVIRSSVNCVGHNMLVGILKGILNGYLDLELCNQTFL